MSKNILVTGGTGYLGSWVVKGLLEKEYTVRITTRDKSRQSKYSHLTQIAVQAPGVLEIYEADLLQEGTFDESVAGCDAIIHMASPFTLRFDDPQEELIKPALTGTQNVLNTATRSETVKKVVLTSSVAAVHGDNIDMKEKGLSEFTEADFNTSSSVSHQPYSYSKVVAEKKAWEIVETQDNWRLVVINPSFVLGPPLNANSNSESIQLMKDMLNGKYYLGAPDLQLGFVDVRDVARAHILALEKEEVEGRFILAERTMSIFDLSRMIKQQFGKKYKLPLMKAPKFMLYLTGWMFGLTRKFIKRNVAHPIKLDTSKSRRILRLKYRSLEKTVEDMIHQMEKLNLV